MKTLKPTYSVSWSPSAGAWCLYFGSVACGTYPTRVKAEIAKHLAVRQRRASHHQTMRDYER